MSTAHENYRMLGSESLWTAAQQSHLALAAVGVPHAIVGGVAVCLHGYRRNTIDVDWLVRRDDQAAVRTALVQSGFGWFEERCEFRSTSGVPIQFLLVGDRAGDDSEVRLPDVGEAAHVELVEGLPVLRLARLIEIKLACGSGNPRRMHRDFADVVELIIAHRLSRAFARHLHRTLRPTFRELVLRSRGE